MWAAFVRQIAAYAITRRGKKLFALVGVLLLCFATTLLIDMKYTLSAGFTGLLAFLSAVAYVVQHFKIKRAERERLKRQAEDARRRAAALEARADRFGNAKAAFGNAVDGMASGISEAARETAEDVAATYQEARQFAADAAGAVTGGVTGAARAGLTRAVKGWRGLRRPR